MATVSDKRKNSLPVKCGTSFGRPTFVRPMDLRQDGTSHTGPVLACGVCRVAVDAVRRPFMDSTVTLLAIGVNFPKPPWPMENKFALWVADVAQEVIKTSSILTKDLRGAGNVACPWENSANDHLRSRKGEGKVSELSNKFEHMGRVNVIHMSQVVGPYVDKNHAWFYAPHHIQRPINVPDAYETV